MVMVLALLCVSTAPSIAQVREHKYKAIFIRNLTKFVIWPDRELNVPNATIRLCTIGNDRIGATLKEIKTGQPGDVTLDIHDNINFYNYELHQCDVVYISRSEERNLELILSKTKDLPILTVSDIDQFAEKGGMIGFIQIDSRVRIEMNIASLERTGLRVKRELRQLVKVIR